MLRFQFLLFIFLMLFQKSNCQENLVPNSSFEKFTDCPTGINKSWSKYITTEWLMVNNGTPDYFNTNCKQMKKMKEIINKIDANSGSGYIGLFVYSANESREFAMTKLSQKLKRNKKYCISFYYSMAVESPLAITDLGIYLSKSKFKFKKTNSKQAQIHTPNNIFLLNTSWQKYCQFYSANGKEQYLTIGNFMNNKMTKKISNPLYILNKKEYSKSFTSIDPYYYIDDVSVIEIKDEKDCSCNDTTKIVKQDIIKFKEIPIDKKLKFEHLLFSTASSVIDTSSYNELNQLVEYLHKNIELKIQISGHTDNVGKEEDNLLLSENRAKAVAEYLKNKGIEQNRITYKGFGSQKPIFNNETEDGKQQNRRVEFMLSK